MCNSLIVLKVSIRASYALLFAVFVTAIFGCGGGSSGTDPSRDIGVFPKIVKIAIESPKNIYGLEDNIRISITFDQTVVVHSNGGAIPKIVLTLWGDF